MNYGPLVRTAGAVVMPTHNTGIQGLPLSKLSAYTNNQQYLVRNGGAIRWRAGSPDGKGGQIFSIMRDVGPSAGKQLVAQGSKLLLGLTGVGAVASVANLAVSAVGFYMMNKKLNALQHEMNNLQNAVATGFSAMEARLIQIQYILGELGEGQKRILEGQEDMKDLSDAASFAPILTVMQGMREHEAAGTTPSMSQTDQWIDRLRDSRNQYQVLVSKWCTGSKPIESIGFARGTGYYKMWGLALITEARLMRLAGRTEFASKLVYQNLGEWYYPTAQKTVSLLVDYDPGVLLAAPFENRISTDQYFAMMEVREGKILTPVMAEGWAGQAEADQQKVFGKSPRERLQNMRTFDSRSKYSRAAEAYSLIELGDRINTLGVEYEICERHQLAIEEWERAPLHDEASGQIHMLPLA